MKSLQQVTAEPNGRIGYQLIKRSTTNNFRNVRKILDQYNIKDDFHEKQPILQ